MARRDEGPVVLKEELPLVNSSYTPYDYTKTGAFQGHIWYNSLYWTNFPPLSCFDESHWRQHKDSSFYTAMSQLNSNKRLGEQYVTYAAAREDLCQNGRMPKVPRTITAEVMQYEGVRDQTPDEYPVQAFAAKRDNHVPYEYAQRRFWDNDVIHVGLNAEEFSDTVMPVGELDACITMTDLTGAPGVYGYRFVLLRIGGWPFRVRRIGTFEGLGNDGVAEQKLGYQEFVEDRLWTLLEGCTTVAVSEHGSRVENTGNQRIGCKYWCQLWELDWLGPKKDDSKAHDAEIPSEKGFVWFEILGSMMHPSTGKKAVRVRLLEDGVVPAWMDLHFLQVWAGDIPLGYVNEANSDGLYDSGRIRVVRLPDSETGDARGVRKVLVENRSNRLIFDEPLKSDPDTIVDLGWAIRDVLYHGARFSVGPRPGKWVDCIEGDVPPNCF